MAKFMICLSVVSIFGALVSADSLAEMIANGAKPAPAGPYYDYVGNTIPEILTRNNMPQGVNQAIDQNRNDIRAKGGRLYPHGLPNVMDPVPSMPRTPQQPVRTNAPAQPKRVELDSPADYIAPTVPVDPLDGLAARIAASKGQAPLVESIRPQPQASNGDSLADRIANSRAQGNAFDNLADRISNGRGQAPMVPTPRNPPPVQSYSGSDDMADKIAKSASYDNIAERIARARN